jgi:hypothetical protein
VTAFGLEIESEWPLPGSTAVSSGPRRAMVRTLPREAVDEAWAQPAERLFRPEFPDGQFPVSVERSRSHYRLWYEDFGRYLVSADGKEVGCERNGVSRERQVRLLLAQALPLASALQGFEVLHASAISTGGRLAAFTGPSGAGKTTMASRLVQRGATLVADDVLALERRPHGLLAHPGPPMMVVGFDDDRPGPAIGTSDKVHVAVPTVARPLPLERLYHLERGRSLQVEPLEDDGVRRVLSSMFAPYLATPGRLQRHLETAQLLSRHVELFRLQMPHSDDLDAALDGVEAHLSEPVR